MTMTYPSMGQTPSSPVLTSSEKAVLQMIAEGYKVEHIGQTLALPEPEIERLLETAGEKLGAQNRLHAVTIAVLNGHIAIGPESAE